MTFHWFLFRFLQHLTSNTLTVGTDFVIVLLCNAYSTNPEFFTRPMATLFETINKNQSSNSQQPMPTVPLPMVTLDSLTVHTKMSLIHRFVMNNIRHSNFTITNLRFVI